MKYLFYRPIQIEHPNEQVLFWSDTHFGHRCDNWETPLWKRRGFGSVEEHDESLINRWNTKSTESTIFFHLGDFIFGYDSENRFERLMNYLKFKQLYIMPGNHCSGWSHCFKKQQENVWQINDDKQVIFVPNYLESCINGQNFIMSHYPILSFNKQHSSSGSSIHLFGHTHNNIRTSEVGKIFYKAKVWEVSIENSPHPISAYEARKMLNNKHPITFDHHNEKTLSPS